MARQEHCVATDKRHDERRGKSVVGSIGLQDTSVGQSAPVKSLDLTRLVEAQERVAHDGEVDELRGGDQADKPAENNSGVLAQLQERQERDGENDSNAEVWNTLLGALGQNLRCLALKRETEKGARCAVDVGVTGGEGRG